MEIEEFKKYLAGSLVGAISLGLFLIGFGAFIAWLYISGADKSSDIGVGGEIILILLIIICVGIGAFVIYNSVNTNLLVKSGKHPLLKAIREKDNDFVVWIFENITKTKGGYTTHTVRIFNRDGKEVTVSLKQEKVKDVITFLTKHFPNAALGFSDELADRMKENVGIKIK